MVPDGTCLWSGVSFAAGVCVPAYLMVGMQQGDTADWPMFRASFTRPWAPQTRRPSM